MSPGTREGLFASRGDTSFLCGANLEHGETGRWVNSPPTPLARAECPCWLPELSPRTGAARAAFASRLGFGAC